MRIAPATVVLLCAVIAPASAEEPHDWCVVKTADGAFAYDAGGIDVSPRTGFKSLSVLSAGEDGSSVQALLTIDCRKKLGTYDGGILQDRAGGESLQLVEGNTDTMPPDAWQSVSDDPTLSLAAYIACKRSTPANVIHVSDQQAALDKLKTLSN